MKQCRALVVVPCGQGGSPPDAPDVQDAFQALLHGSLVEEGHLGGRPRHIHHHLPVQVDCQPNCFTFIVSASLVQLYYPGAHKRAHGGRQGTAWAKGKRTCGMHMCPCRPKACPAREMHVMIPCTYDAPYRSMRHSGIDQRRPGGISDGNTSPLILRSISISALANISSPCLRNVVPSPETVNIKIEYRTF